MEDVMLDDRHFSRKLEPNSIRKITRRFAVQMVNKNLIVKWLKIDRWRNVNNTKKVFIKVILSLHKGYHEY